MTTPDEHEIRQRRRNQDLLTRYDAQPYDARVAGFDILIEKGVFPSDIGFATELLAKGIINHCRARPIATAIDIGTGAGVLALVMATQGIPLVYATDNHPAAIECARHNIVQHGLRERIALCEGDLLDGVPEGITFDLGVFNHTYYPIRTRNYFGSTNEGGRDLIERFLVRHAHRIRTILMPYTPLSGPEHDPGVIARRHGFASLITIPQDAACEGTVIYEITSPMQSGTRVR